ncbi:MAG: bifunctional UDP-N-acetylglucosamine diphosphorylase/glucosamine-1-phosphate N-acetyltransferase GlmU [Chloroflexi bacterium]|nr:bifunctional UDP-N-acetylglucosamine diphosphorylase/glucosamine-1-phosphate N-acetyltransferase GlmU [Chloroflexota bacterium]MQC48167.1 UDP-N-acetylglucosamine diphosphorylase/glucosamine-1-phosphate N-acetyltransferase [Chloroflexota bacterium]
MTALASPMTNPVASLKGWTAVVLAAGPGTRMRSAVPKVLHPVAGIAMVRLVCDLLREAGCERIVAVASPGTREAVGAACGADVDLVEQASPLGTGDAALAARDAVRPGGNVLIVHADMPLLTTRTLLEMAGRHVAVTHALTIMTAYLEDPRGYARVERRNGKVQGIVQESDLSAAMRGQPEVNAGLYAADVDWLWDHLAALPRSNRGEVGLADLIAAAVRDGGVEAYQVTEAAEVQQVNDRIGLANAERVLRDRIRRRLMLEGVTLVDPPSTFIDAGVRVAPDTTLLPGVHLLGNTTVGSGCRIGPNAVLRDMTVADRVEIDGSTLEGSTIAEGVTVGPYCHLRPGSVIGRDVHLGNYVEVKASSIGERTQVGHFSYIGDAEVGAGVNIGAGTITVNYDGVAKHRTVIGDGAFVGSDSLLVAPVRLGVGARTAAGAVVTSDVPDGALVMGVPARIQPGAEGGR